MADPIGSANPTNQSEVQARTKQRRSNVIRRIIFLAIATVALVAFVAGLNDVRRRDWAMSQCRWYGEVLSKRLTDQGDWPIDLQVDINQKDTQASPTEMYKISWLSPDEVRRLSPADQSILVAWTRLVPQIIRSDGHGCVVFKNNSFETVWLSDQEFIKRKTTQQAH